MKTAFLMVWYTIFSIVFFGVVLSGPLGLRGHETGLVLPLAGLGARLIVRRPGP